MGMSAGPLVDIKHAAHTMLLSMQSSCTSLSGGELLYDPVHRKSLAGSPQLRGNKEMPRETQETPVYVSMIWLGINILESKLGINRTTASRYHSITRLLAYQQLLLQSCGGWRSRTTCAPSFIDQSIQSIIQTNCPPITDLKVFHQLHSRVPRRAWQPRAACDATRRTARDGSTK